MRKADLVTAGLAVVVHAGIGLAISRSDKRPPPPPHRKPVVLQYERRPETPPAPPEHPSPSVAPPPSVRAPATRKVAMRSHRAPAPEPASAPARATSAPAERPATTPTPVYAVAMTSTTAVGAMTVPRGDVGLAGLRRAGGSPSGLPGGTGNGAGDGYHPASAREVGSMPDVDVDACGRAAIYPRDAEQSGTEGDVRLRVSLTERGMVHAVRVLSGLGHGLDAAAIDAIKNRCRFKPAIGRDGQPVAFVIESYTFHFELPR